MNEMENQSNSNSTAALQELQQEVQSLRSFVMSVVVIVIVLSGAVNFYLLRQASLVTAQLAIQTEENKRNVEEFTTQTGPALAGLWKSVNDYAKANPDLQPLLAKYNFQGTLPSAPPASAPGIPPKK